HVGGFAAEEEVVARRREEIDHLGVFAKPSFVLCTSRNNHHVALAADPLLAAEPELHLALEHPHDLLIWVTVRLDMGTSPYAPPDDHPLVARENAAAVFSLICSSSKRANVPKPISVGMSILPNQDRLDSEISSPIILGVLRFTTIS